MTTPLPVPTGAGISGSDIAGSVSITTTGLAVDTGATPGPPPSGPLFTVIESATTRASATPSTDALSSGSSKSISLGTVIGSCVGAFIAVSALIVFGFWFYRRYSESLRRKGQARGPRAHDRNLKNRRWSKLEEGKDNVNQTKEVGQVVPMEKLTMFKRGVSVRTAYTHKSVDEHPLTYPNSFAPFDANLVRNLSADSTDVPQPQSPRGANPSKSQTPSNLSQSNSLGGPLSSSVNMAIPTPEATVLQSHKWESAEVVHYEDQSAEIVEPSIQDKDVRGMHNANPFFGSQEHLDYRQSRSDPTSNVKSPKAKGKERMRDSMASSDPFQDEEFVTQLPNPIFAHHQATDSSASTQSKERALQNLMGALELSEDEVRERLRVASMQPSVVSQTSPDSTVIDEEDFKEDFRLPPLGGNLGKF